MNSNSFQILILSRGDLWSPRWWYVIIPEKNKGGTEVQIVILPHVDLWSPRENKGGTQAQIVILSQGTRVEHKSG